MSERFANWNIKEPSFVIDTTHCVIQISSLEKMIGYSNNLFTFKDHKHGCYSIKYQYVVSMNSPRICHISSGFPGSIHDLTIARLSGIANFAFQNNEMGIGDKAYGGCTVFFTPYKSYQNHPLTEEQIQYNKRLYEYRNNVEVNARVKIFKSTVFQWRHSILDHYKMFYAVSYIVNLSFIFRPLNRNDL